MEYGTLDTLLILLYYLCLWIGILLSCILVTFLVDWIKDYWYYTKRYDVKLNRRKRWKSKR